MNQLFLVIHREYTTRVRKLSFVLTTILTPVLLSLIVLLPAYFATNPDSEAVIDEAHLFKPLLGILLGFVIYMFIFMFSIRVMRAVLEEKNGRIVELILTSISPVKFMAGKIAGIALVAFTQIFCWIIIISVARLFIPVASGVPVNISQPEINTIAFSFLFFFIGGYLLYSSIFAAISAAGKSDEEVGQFSMIVTIPLIAAIVVVSSSVYTPHGSLAYWFSMIPFTSPVVMMSRVVHGVPLQEIFLSMFLLVVTVAAIVWLSGKIYKMTILYTGKKVKIRDIISWIKPSNTPE